VFCRPCKDRPRFKRPGSKKGRANETAHRKCSAGGKIAVHSWPNSLELILWSRPWRSSSNTRAPRRAKIALGFRPDSLASCAGPPAFACNPGRNQLFFWFFRAPPGPSLMAGLPSLHLDNPSFFPLRFPPKCPSFLLLSSSPTERPCRKALMMNRPFLYRGGGRVTSRRACERGFGLVSTPVSPLALGGVGFSYGPAPTEPSFVPDPGSPRGMPAATKPLCFETISRALGPIAFLARIPYHGLPLDLSLAAEAPPAFPRSRSRPRWGSVAAGDRQVSR